MEILILFAQELISTQYKPKDCFNMSETLDGQLDGIFIIGSDG